MALLLPSQSAVLTAYAVLTGTSPGNIAFKEHQAFINTPGVGVNGYKAALEGFLSGTSTATLATALITNLGLTSFTQAQAIAFLNANPGNRVGAMIDLSAQLYNYTGTDAGLLAAKNAYVSTIDSSYAYSVNAANTGELALSGTASTSISLTVGFDNLVGTSGNDIFDARIINNANTAQSGDKIDGGAGIDRLNLDIGNSQNFSITLETKGVEQVAVRGQAVGVDSANNNITTPNPSNSAIGQIASTLDAQRMVGVTQWESNNSRSDVIIEDVRIASGLATKSVTIAMVETDPGNVDFGVYFNQLSLRNTSTGTSALNVFVMDVAAAQAPATAATPLLNQNFNGYIFYANGVKVVLGGEGTAAGAAIDAATTYAALRSAFELSLKTAKVGPTGAVQDLSGGGITVSLSAPVNFTTETLKATESATVAASFLNLTGQILTLSSGSTTTISSKAPGQPDGGLTQSGIAPSTGAIVQTFNSGSSTSSELVTSKIILDDVGMGSTGGDLVVGGMSVGETSDSKGVERFEIEVRDNSRLQTINGTNNALREVTLVNGVTDNVNRTTTTSTTDSAYRVVTENAGDLTVNGNINRVGAAVAGTGTEKGTGSDTILKGVNNSNTPLNGYTADHHGAFGFTDVRIIDANSFKGKLAFTAQITQDSVKKYVDLVDTGPSPVADVAGNGVVNANFNVKGANFIYTGGVNDDKMVVSIDPGVVSSRSTKVSGQSDFTFNFFGGAGDDEMTVNVTSTTLAGGAQAWYTNQSLNKNITINGGDGNDTINKPGAGDVTIDAGAGNDTVYTDNTGNLSVDANATGFAGTAAAAYTAATTAELAAAQAAFALSNTTGFVPVAGSNTGATVTTTAVVTALNTLDLLTPVTYQAAAAPVAAQQAPTYAQIQTGIDAAVTAGGLTFAQAIALSQAYKTQTTLGVVTPQNTLAQQVITPGTAQVAGVISAADFAAGNTLLQTYIDAANAAAATASAADTNKVTNTALLNVTQLAVANAVDAQIRVVDNVGVVTETATFTPAAITAPGGSAATLTVNGRTITIAAAATATAADIVTALGTGVTTGNAVVSGTNNAAAYTAAAVGATVVYTSASAIPGFNPTDLSAAAVNVATVPVPVIVQGVGSGTQTYVNNLAALQSALVVGASDASVVTALQAALTNGALTTAQANALFTAANFGSGALIATQAEVDNANLVLLPLIAGAANANTAAAATLTAAITANTTAINTAAGVVAADPRDVLNNSNVANDSVGSTEAATAVTAATALQTTANTAVTNANTKAADLAALKTAIVGSAVLAGATTELQVAILTTNAAAKGTITAVEKTTIDTAAGSLAPTVGGFVDLTEKYNVDLAITALQTTQNTVVGNAVAVAANAATVVAATTIASAAASAATASGANSATVVAPRGVFVFDTSNQTSTYNRLTQDDRNLADLKSDANNTYNFFNATVKVSFKGLDASVVVAGTGFKTSDLEINQAIKLAINKDAVLSKLLVATDGPANSLVVTSLIDGALKTADLAVAVTMATSVNSADLAGAITAGLVAAGSTDAALITAMGVAKAAFDTKGDYVTQFAESGAAAGNTVLIGANSTASTDNIVTPGTGNDVIVLSTTAQIDALSSSNEIVVFSGTSFGSDTIVNFAATGLGIDRLNFSALGGTSANFGSLSADKSVVVGAATAVGATALTAVQIAALFTDSATAITHVYVAVNADNIGSIWQVADAAGTAAGNVTATLVGSVDLADTLWSTLTAANFV